MSPSRPPVLLVDDEVELTNSLKQKLEEEGFRVSVCDEASAAEALASSRKFCCIVVDLKLKQGSGDQLITRLRRDEGSPNQQTPVLLMSAHLSKEVLRKIGGLVQGTLEKPFARGEFSERVKKLCPRSPEL
jgi:DNA-binding response OmpR family regulator